MMRDKISFLILTHQGSTTRQFVTSKKTLKKISVAAMGLLFISLVFVGYFSYDYLRLHNAKAEIAAMEDLIASQQKEISGQRKEIQTFAEKINRLTDELLALKEYEERVRELTDIKDSEKTGKEDNQGEKSKFGVGGPLPEDTHIDIELKKQHGLLIDAMHQQTEKLKLTSIRQSDGIKSLLEELLEKQKRADHMPSICPVNGQTTSKFGYRRSAFSNKREFHKGYDIGAPKGTPIVATADGSVTFAGRDGSFGKVVVIDHGYGFKTRYAHADKIIIKRGAKVKKGEIIARVGSTGRSTGPHVHYEVLKKGVPVNPKKYFLN